MKTNDLPKFFENFNLSNVEMPVHQRRLRQALLVHGQNQQTIHTSFWTTFKNLIGREFKSRRFTLIGSGATVAIVAVLGLTSLSSHDTPYARAEGLVNRSIETMQSVPPEARARFTKDFGRDPLDFLEEAKQAKDLATLTQVELESELLEKYGIVKAFISDADGKNLRRVTASKGLRYTDPSGNIVLLGLDDNDALILAAAPASVFEVHGG